jgi:hypothetical protein
MTNKAAVMEDETTGELSRVADNLEVKGRSLPYFNVDIRRRF